MVHVAMRLVRQPGRLERNVDEEEYAQAPSTDSLAPRLSARDQCPNQRARRMAPNCSFSAAYSSAGS
jgi:hypothetical protein